MLICHEIVAQRVNQPEEQIDCLGGSAINQILVDGIRHRCYQFAYAIAVLVQIRWSEDRHVVGRFYNSLTIIRRLSRHERHEDHF